MLKKYLWEIFAIADENGVSLPEGASMFRANLKARSGVNPGATIDWATVGMEWDELGDSGQAEANAEIRPIIRPSGKTYAALCKAYEEGSRDKFDAILFPKDGGEP